MRLFQIICFISKLFSHKKLILFTCFIIIFYLSLFFLNFPFPANVKTAFAQGSNYWSLVKDGSNNLNFIHSNGTKAMTITANGYLGIGAANPGVSLDAQFDVANGDKQAIRALTTGGMSEGDHTAFALYYAAPGKDYLRLGVHSNGVNNPDYSYILNPQNLPLAFRINNTEQMRIYPNGTYIKQLIGTTDVQFDVANGDKQAIRALTTGGMSEGDHTAFALYYAAPGKDYLTLGINSAGVNNPAYSYVSSTQNFPLVFRTNNTEKVRIQENGNVGIGTANPQGRFSVSNGASDELFRINDAGSVYLKQLVGVTAVCAGVDGVLRGCVSDKRLKKNINTLTDALSTVLNLRGVEFEWDTTNPKAEGLGKGKQIGVIAQEVEKVLPELVSTDPNGYKSVAYQNLTAVLIEAIKQQQKEITTQQQEIQNLKKEVEILKNR